MVQNILDYLEATAADCPDKPAFEDLEHSYTFAQVLGNAKRIGSALIHVLPQNAPVPVLMEKEAWTLNVFMGAVCAGCFYTLVEPEQPDEPDPHDPGYAGGRGHRYQRKAVRESCCPWIHW